MELKNMTEIDKRGKKKKKETSRLGNGIETEGKRDRDRRKTGPLFCFPLKKGWTQH